MTNYQTVAEMVLTVSAPLVLNESSLPVNVAVTQVTPRSHAYDMSLIRNVELGFAF